jgi:hypothetical protein
MNLLAELISMHAGDATTAAQKMGYTREQWTVFQSDSYISAAMTLREIRAVASIVGSLPELVVEAMEAIEHLRLTGRISMGVFSPFEQILPTGNPLITELVVAGLITKEAFMPCLRREIALKGRKTKVCRRQQS